MREPAGELLSSPPAIAESLPENPRTAVFLGGTGFGLVGQLLFVQSMRVEPLPRVIGSLVMVLPVALALCCWHRSGAPWLRTAIVTGAFGGLGMAAGEYLDRIAGAGNELCAPPGVEALAGWGAWHGGWSDVLMLTSCLIACRWLCPEPGSRGLFHDWSRQAGSLAAMWLGMVLGGRQLFPLVARFSGDALAMHNSMVFGMMAGTSLINRMKDGPPQHV